MNLCDTCNGACCKVLLALETKLMKQDFRCFIAMHKDVTQSAGYLFLESRCRNLGVDGRCNAYEHRPNYCKRFVVGGKLCRACRALYNVA